MRGLAQHAAFVRAVIVQRRVDGRQQNAFFLLLLLVGVGIILDILLNSRSNGGRFLGRHYFG